MKAYRYNAKNRFDRKFNRCGEEKNPNMVKFYATNMKYAEKYRFIYDCDGEVEYECELETVTIEGVNLFDMEANFKNLQTFHNYNNAIIESMRRVLNNVDYDKETESISNALIHNEFQGLSDFSRQNELIAELRSLGFEGYFTKNEIAIF